MRVWIVIVLATVSAGVSAQAADVRFVGETPLASKNEEDMRLFRRAVGKALNDTADGQTLTWEHPGTEASGEIKLIRTDDMHATLCRIVQVRNQANGRETRRVYRACKEANGNWRLVAQGTAAQKPRARAEGKPKSQE